MKTANDVLGLGKGPLNLDPVATANLVSNGPELVWHAAASPSATQGVLNGIDPKYLNPDSRFGAAFYVAEKPRTTIAELVHHGVDATHGIRFSFSMLMRQRFWT